jgi:hypothetical protein
MDSIELTNENNNDLRDNIDDYNSVEIYSENPDTGEKVGLFEYELTNEMKTKIKNSAKHAYIGYIIFNNIADDIRPQFINNIYLKKNIEKGGGKNKIKIYSVKELRDIALKNKLKITKNINKKIVNLNKQELIIKMKKNNLRYYYFK